jgi:hypothetical protein
VSVATSTQVDGHHHVMSRRPPDVRRSCAWQVVAGLAVLMLTSCSGGAAAMQTINGTEILTNTGATPANAPCSGDYGAATFEDLGTGAIVGVTDQNGNAIGTGKLGQGTVNTANGGECVWKFRVRVPTNVTSYNIQVGQRPVVTFSQNNLSSNKWAAVLTVDGTGG